VSSPRAAELTKLIENTFRHVNIALVNELALYAHEMGVDIWESLEAAATKPFGYLPFWPGPGWGGHCIPLDPAYLSYRVRQDRAHDVRFVELAHTINSEMPRFVTQRSAELLNEHGKAVRGSKILGVGMAFKGGVEDTRGSAGVKILSLLAHSGAEVTFHDPLVDSIELDGKEQPSVELTPEACREADLVVVFINQDNVDWDLIREESRAVLDCCNALGGRSHNIVRL
jgi:nucleotide sugar dehydrogenase